MKKIADPPAWLVVGTIVDYCSIIGREPTERALVVHAGPQQMGGEWVVWLAGKAGCVSVLACQPAAANDAPAEVQVEVRAAEVGQNPDVWNRFMDCDQCVESDLERIGVHGTLSLGALSLDAAHVFLNPPPRWTTGQERDYWSGWLGREIATHDDRETRDADAWPWDVTRPVAGQYEEQFQIHHDVVDALADTTPFTCLGDADSTENALRDPAVTARNVEVIASDMPNDEATPVGGGS